MNELIHSRELTWNSLCRLAWTQIYDNSSASAFHVLRWYVPHTWFLMDS